MSPLDADVLVIGCGPAGIQAAIHASRAGASVVVVGKPNGSAIYASDVENYFGLPGVVPGEDLVRAGLDQMRSFGAVFVEGNILSAVPADGGFSVKVEDGTDIAAKAVVLATGVSRRKLGVPGEKELLGRGVSYCAVCDCNFYKGRTVAIAGSQSEAAMSADLMTKYASKVYWISPLFDVDPSLKESAASAGVEILQHRITRICGEGKVSSVVLDDGSEISVDGVFIELGGKSSADIAMDLGLMPELDDTIAVKRDCSTSVPGVFACGDVTGRPWQVAKAVGEGAVAGSSAASYAKKVGM